MKPRSVVRRRVSEIDTMNAQVILILLVLVLIVISFLLWAAF